MSLPLPVRKFGNVITHAFMRGHDIGRSIGERYSDLTKAANYSERYISGKDLFKLDQVAPLKDLAELGYTKKVQISTEMGDGSMQTEERILVVLSANHPAVRKVLDKIKEVYKLKTNLYFGQDITATISRRLSRFIQERILEALNVNGLIGEHRFLTTGQARRLMQANPAIKTDLSARGVERFAVEMRGAKENEAYWAKIEQRDHKHLYFDIEAIPTPSHKEVSLSGLVFTLPA
jgi:hypothetical protein